jgi:hypothetical protein
MYDCKRYKRRRSIGDFAGIGNFIVPAVVL